MYIGIEQSSEMVFEGNSFDRAHLVWPLPLLTPAKFSSVSVQSMSPTEIGSYGISEYIFREDAFDPVTRIRRGRFYRKWHVQTEKWLVLNILANRQDVEPRVFTYESCPSSDISFTSSGSQQLVILGAGDAFSIWTIINKELVHTRETVVSLKARQSFGALPDVDWRIVPDATGLVREKIESLRDDIYRAGAESVVDRAREAATAILSAYLQNEGIKEANGKDLGALIALLDKRNDKNGQRIVRCAAEIPRRLHSRAKHAEQESRDNIRPIRQQDAELAVQCIGVMLCDLDWASWS